MKRQKERKSIAYCLFPVVVARIVRKGNFYVYFTVLYMPLNNILLTYHQFELFQKKKKMKKLYWQQHILCMGHIIGSARCCPHKNKTIKIVHVPL